MNEEFNDEKGEEKVLLTSRDSEKTPRLLLLPQKGRAILRSQER